MTLDEFRANKELMLEASKWRITPLASAMFSVLNDEYRRLGIKGIYAGFSEVDKAEGLGMIQGFNKSITVLDQMFTEPRPVPREVESTYGADSVIAKSKKEKK